MRIAKCGIYRILSFLFIPQSAIRISQLKEHARQQAVRIFGQIVEGELKLAFLCTAAAAGDQAGQTAVGGAVGGPQDDRRGVDQCDLGADQQFQADLLRGAVCPHYAGQAVAVGDGQRRVAQLGGTLHEFVGMRSALQEREVRLAMQFCIPRSGRRRGRGSEHWIAFVG